MYYLAPIRTIADVTTNLETWEIVEVVRYEPDIPDGISYVGDIVGSEYLILTNAELDLPVYSGDPTLVLPSCAHWRLP